jgi:hypothetical protein
MSDEHGMPIYSDIERQLTDTVKFDNEDHAWVPGNRAAHKLFRCVECIRDIRGILEAAGAASGAEKRQRLVKSLYTPLKSLATCLFDLLDHCEGNPDTVKKMPKGSTKLVPHLKRLLNEHLPIGKNGLLSLLRDKTAAHVDGSLSASEARDLQKKAALHEVGFWLHVCIMVFCDLLKLPIYSWSCPSEHPGVIRIMMCEPFLMSMKIADDGTIKELVGAHIADSPRNDIKDLIVATFEQSRWMFRPGDRQIQGFYLDQPGDSWAQSLVKPPKPPA